MKLSINTGTIEDVFERTRRDGATLVLSGVHAQPLIALERAGLFDLIGPDQQFPVRILLSGISSCHAREGGHPSTLWVHNQAREMSFIRLKVFFGQLRPPLSRG